MKLYTKTGDDGHTGLLGGERVSKDNARVQAYGDIDELNAILGWCAIAADARIIAPLQTIQADLFCVGAELATPPASQNPAGKTFVQISDEHVQRLEQAIDDASGQTAALSSFILPGGGEGGARLHVARAACRRAERAVVTLGHGETVRPAILQYINRLADLLFAWARLQNSFDGRPETPWTPGA